MPSGEGGDCHATADEPISELIKRARLALGLSRDRLAGRLADLSKDPCAIRELVARWERGKRIPGPYWCDLLSKVLGLSGGVLERAASLARVRRILVAVSAPSRTSISSPR
jgi:transcriptional regulator with XRE-family HTH domain